MKCFGFSNGTKKDEPGATKSPSGRSYYTNSTDRDMTRSGSLFNSQDVSDISVESMGRNEFPSFSQQPSNLRVFTYSELKSATKNFSRSLMVGEGGFGCVYKGMIKSLESPNSRQQIAVKQLNPRGLQARFFHTGLFSLLTGISHFSSKKQKKSSSSRRK